MRIGIHHPDADPDADSDYFFTRIRMRIRLFTLTSFQIKAQTLEKVLKKTHIPYILFYHLQIDANTDPIPDPVDHFDADPDFFYLMRMWIRMRIQVTKKDEDPCGSGFHNAAGDS
jgi:hypothetical protein